MKKKEDNYRQTLIDQCQMELLEVKQTLQTYGILFKVADCSDLEENALYGMGLAVDNLNQRLENALCKLNDIY